MVVVVRPESRTRHLQVERSSVRCGHFTQPYYLKSQKALHTEFLTTTTTDNSAKGSWDPSESLPDCQQTDI
jgi:hypothetical protein